MAIAVHKLLILTETIVVELKEHQRKKVKEITDIFDEDVKRMERGQYVIVDELTPPNPVHSVQVLGDPIHQIEAEYNSRIAGYVVSDGLYSHRVDVKDTLTGEVHKGCDKELIYFSTEKKVEEQNRERKKAKEEADEFRRKMNILQNPFLDRPYSSINMSDIFKNK